MTLAAVDFPTLGFAVIDWIEAHLVHGPGDVQGEPIVLDDELALFLAHAYRLHPETGQRVFRRAVLSRPKGRAKSELAGMVVCAEALGPVRFARWDAHGEPVGRSVTAPYVRCLATEEGQASNTYANVMAMLSDERIADAYPGVDVGLTRTFVPGGGLILPSTASSAAKEGGRETFAVADETHLYVGRELRAMHATVRRNLGKRKIAEPWMLDTTTAHRPGEQSIAEEVTEFARAAGEARTRAAGVLWDHREAPAVKNFADDHEVLEALRSVYGPAGAWMDLGRLLAEIRDPSADEADSRRYWLNQVVAASEQWIDPRDWMELADRAATVLDGTTVALGFDGGQFDDATALVGCRLEDGFLFTLGVWQKPLGPASDGWEVPRAAVNAAVVEAFARFNVVRAYFDPPLWQSELDRWAAEWGDVVTQWWTNRERAMAHALERLHTAVRTRDVRHDGDERLARHVANARRRETRSGVQIQKPRPRSPHKIDAAVAATLAFEARADAVAAGALKPRNRRRAVFI